jgi:hypothetical protein
LQAGVAEVWIAPGREPNICARLLAASASAPTGCGTKVIAN